MVALAAYVFGVRAVIEWADNANPTEAGTAGEVGEAASSTLSQGEPGASVNGEPAPGGAGPAPGTRDNSMARQVTLAPGTYTVGTEIQPGHYAITTDSEDIGQLRIDGTDEPLKANELLGEDEFKLGAAKYVTDLAGGDTLLWEGVSPITLTPAETKLATRLAPGNYVVGLDVPAGDYVVAVVGDWDGNLRIYTSDGVPVVNRILLPETSESPVRVTLEDGQRVDVSGVTALEFETP
ncbi:MAG: hypothetical protein LBS27_04190 [Bifidobacteriaceae bacterium]|nr:hypothetical protein [Bifidobacteriaceae bacterium]